MLTAIKKLLERSAYFISSTLTIIIAYLSLASLSEMNVQIEVSDKILHTVAYFTLTTSWFFAVKKSHESIYAKLFICLSIILFGIILEILQEYLTENRMMDYHDVLANSLGIFVALISFNLLYRFFKTI